MWLMSDFEAAVFIVIVAAMVALAKATATAEKAHLATLAVVHA